MLIFLCAHVVISTLVACALATVFHHLSPWIAVVSLLIGYGASVPLKGLFPSSLRFGLMDWTPGFSGLLEKVFSAFLLYFCYRHFAYLFYQNDADLFTLSLNNFGDLPLHINYIRSLAGGVSFPPLNPLYSQELLRYPFGIDLYSALWECLGVPLRAHLFVVGILFSVAALVALRSWAGWWGIVGFFLSGGFSGWQAFHGKFGSEIESQLAWKNLFMTVWVTQRGMLFAIPAGLVILKSVHAHLLGEITLSKRQSRVLGLLWGAMALFHLHTFFILSLLLASFAFLYRNRARSLLPILPRALVLGTVFILYSTGFFQKAKILHWQWGWLAEGKPFPSFLLFNFGPWLILLVFTAGLFACRRSYGRLRWEFLLYLFWFILFFNLMVAPWAWDNIKVLIWPYLGFLYLFNQVFDAELGAEGLAATALVLSFSGFVEFAPTLLSNDKAQKIYSLTELGKVEGAIEKIPYDAVFAAANTHDHALSYFGRMRVLGYEGHLWSHGIDSRATTEKFQRLMRGEPDWPALLKELHVSYIFWGPAERELFGNNEKPWQKVLVNVSRVPGYEVYDVGQ